MKIKKRLVIYIFSFCIPIFLFLITLIFLKLSDKNFVIQDFLISDMRAQYISFYNYIRDVFLGNSSIFYSFSKGLGGNMASTIGYYLSSPLNILYIFVSKIDIPLMVFIVYMIKISLCSLFMCIFLSNKFDYKYTNILFSLFYAFMGFTTVYHFNAMWIDVIYMTPLVILGIDKLFKGQSILYIITLSLSLIFNFYMAYMLCIFCLIYFLYELFKKYKIKDFELYKKILIKFILSSILAFLLSSIFLFPVIYNMGSIHRYPLDTNLLKINFLDLIKNFFNVFSKTYIYSHDIYEYIGLERPVVYVNLFCIVLLIFYFINNKISSKEKKLSFSVILFFWLSFIIPILSLIWHGFSFPNGYIGRFSFLYCFFVIYLSCRCFYNKSKYNFKILLIIVLIYIIISVYINSLNFNFLGNNKIFLNCTIFSIYLILYFFFCQYKSKKYLMCIVLISLFELYGNYYNTIIFLDGVDYKKFYSKTCSKINNIEQDFYRIEGDYYYNYMDSFVCNTNGIKIDSSSSDKNIYNFLYNNGFPMNYIKINYNFNELPIIDSLLGVKYIVSTQKTNEYLYRYHDSFVSINNNSNEEFYIDEQTKIYIYKNPYALSLGYAVEDGLENLSIVNDKNNSFENLNMFVSKLSGIDDKVLKPIKKEKIMDNKYIFNLENIKDEYLFFSIKYKLDTHFMNYGTLYINNSNILNLTIPNIGILQIKNNYKDSEILLEIKTDQDEYIGEADLYTYDLEVFERAIDKLKQNQLDDVVVKGNKVSGTINVDKKSTLFLSIPYEKGWNVYVDGKKTPYYKIADTFIGIDISEGKHKIEMKFYPPGLILGGVVTSVSIIILIINNYINKRK